MHSVLQVMMSAGDSTAIVGRTISDVVLEFRFHNLYVHGDKRLSKDEGRCKTTVLGFGKKSISGIFRYISMLVIYAKLYKQRPSLIVAHRYKCVDVSSFLSKIYKVPLVIVVHGVGEFDRPYRARKLNTLVRRGATVVCVSKYVENYIKSCLHEKVKNSLAGEQIITIENSIDFSLKRSEQVSKQSARDSLAVDNINKLLVGYVGRLANVKGVVDVVDASTQFEHSGVHFVIVGDGPLAPELKKNADCSSIANNLSFLGFVPDAYRYFKAFDLIVLPSRSEGFPLTLLEAVAARVPFITTDIEVYREVVGNDKVFYTPGDVDELCERISFMLALQQAGKLDSFGKEQGLQIESKYPFSGFINSYTRLLERLV